VAALPAVAQLLRVTSCPRRPASLRQSYALAPQHRLGNRSVRRARAPGAWRPQRAAPRQLVSGAVRPAAPSCSVLSPTRSPGGDARGCSTAARLPVAAWPHAPRTRWASGGRRGSGAACRQRARGPSTRTDQAMWIPSELISTASHRGDPGAALHCPGPGPEHRGRHQHIGPRGVAAGSLPIQSSSSCFGDQVRDGEPRLLVVAEDPPSVARAL
jgi:hypothetical protein